MRTFKFGKLVRDKVVGDIRQEGGEADYRILEQDEFIAELTRKLQEETNELSGSKKEDTLKELADIQEIIDTLLEALGITPRELKEARETKNSDKGPFKERYYIGMVRVPETSPWIKYLSENSERYPEVKK